MLPLTKTSISEDEFREAAVPLSEGEVELPYVPYIPHAKTTGNSVNSTPNSASQTPHASESWRLVGIV